VVAGGHGLSISALEGGVEVSEQLGVGVHGPRC
jgi:hypothetical protein